MTSIHELHEEIARLKDELEQARDERDRLSDEHVDVLNRYEEEFDSRKLAMEQNMQTQIKEARAPLESLVQKLRTDLDLMHRASTGDPCGWREHVTINENGGEVVGFVNDETGERQKEIPPIYDFCLRSRRLEQAQVDHEGLLKAKERLKELEVLRRKTQVETNELRASAAILKSKVKSWESASDQVRVYLKAFEQSFNLVHDRITERSSRLDSMQNSAERMNKTIMQVSRRVLASNNYMNEQISKLLFNNKTISKLNLELNESRQKLIVLENEMEDQISTAIAPMKVELANANVQLMKEKAQRIDDRIHLANLWPIGWMIPTILSRYKSYQDIYRKKATSVEKERFQDVNRKPMIPRSVGRNLFPVINDQIEPACSNTSNYSNWEESIEDGCKCFINTETGEKALFKPDKRDEFDEKWKFAKLHVAEAARIVIIYMKGQKRQLLLNTDDIFPYDIYSVEELAEGQDGWKFSDLDRKDDQGMVAKKSDGINVNGKITWENLRSQINKASIREKKLWNEIKQTQSDIIKLSAKILHFEESSAFVPVQDKDNHDESDDKNIIQESTASKTIAVHKKDPTTPTNNINVDNMNPGEGNDLGSDICNTLNKVASSKIENLSGIVEILVEEAVWAGFRNKPIHKPRLLPKIDEIEQWLYVSFFTKQCKSENNFDVSIDFNEIKEEKLELIKSDEKLVFESTFEWLLSEEYKEQQNEITKGGTFSSPEANLNEFNHLINFITTYQNLPETNTSLHSQHKNLSLLEETIAATYSYVESYAYRPEDKDSSLDSDIPTIINSDENEDNKAVDLSAKISLHNESLIHETTLHQLHRTAEAIKQIIDKDHHTFIEHLKTSIEQTNREIKDINNKIMNTQNKIARLDGKLNGLNIEPSKPLPPQEPLPIELFPIPKNDSDHNDADVFMTDSEFTLLLDTIKNAEVPSSKVAHLIRKTSLTNLQKENIISIIEKKNEGLSTSYEKALKRHSELVSDYLANLNEFDCKEIERKRELSDVQSQLWMSQVTFIFFRGLKQLYEQRHRWYQLELIDEDIRGNDLLKSQQYDEMKLGQQLYQQLEGKRAISELGNNLYHTLGKRKWLEENKMSATSYLDYIELQKQEKEVEKYLEHEIFRSRELLIKEGKRREELYLERLRWMHSSIRKLQEGKRMIEERKNMFDLIELLLTGTITSIQSLHGASLSEDITNHIGTQEWKVMTEKNLEDIKWFSSDAFDCSKTVVDMKKRVQVAMQSRIMARKREFRFRRICQFWQHDSSDSSLQEPEKQRLKEKLDLMNDVIERGTIAIKYQMSREKSSVDALRTKVNMLICDINAIKKIRDNDIRMIKHAVHQSIKNLKQQLSNLHAELTNTRTVFKTKVAELYLIQKQTKEKLEGKIKALCEENETICSIAEALRYDLSKINAKEHSTQLELKKLKSMWLDRVSTMKEQMKTEQNHSARLELMIASLQEAIKYEKEKMSQYNEKYLRQQKEYEMKLSKHKNDEWRQILAVQELGTNVDAMFLFFLQRLSNLAGASTEYNNKLREHGAIQLFTLFSRSPCEDLRILAVKGLGNMGWNDMIEKRVLCWDVFHTWKEWVQYIDANKENLYLGRKSQPFDEPHEQHIESFRSRRQWVLRRRRKMESPNEINQFQLGSNQDLLSDLLQMTSTNRKEKHYAIFALSIASYQRKNSKYLARIQNLIPTIVDMLHDDDLITCSFACVIVGNIALGNKKWRETFTAHDGIAILLNLCRGTNLVIVENASAALANIFLSYSKEDVEQNFQEELHVLMHLITNELTANLVDIDQMSEIHANVADCLASLSSIEAKIAEHICEIGVSPLILLCGSKNLHVGRKSALVLGNIALHSQYRDLIGANGGIEALFLLCEENDEEVQKKSFWALSNLAWDPHNQVRISKYFNQLIGGCKSAFPFVQTNALCCLANIVCYNEKNRSNLAINVEEASLICRMCSDTYPEPTQFSALRTILSLSYSMSHIQGLKMKLLIPDLIKRCFSEDHKIQKAAGMILFNLTIDAGSKIVMVMNGGVEALTQMKKSEYQASREIAQLILNELAGVCFEKELAKKKNNIGIKGLLQLCKSKDISTQKFAFDTLAEEIWMDTRKQMEIIDAGGIDIIFEECTKAQLDDRVLIAALWVMRNLSYNNKKIKDNFGKKGIEILLKICKEKMRNNKFDPHLMESILTALINLAVDHETNSRKLLDNGGNDIVKFFMYCPQKFDPGNDIVQSYTMRSNKILARTLLQILDSYNNLICGNCKQEQLQGNTCEMCGHQMIFSSNKYVTLQLFLSEKEDQEELMLSVQ